MKVTYKIKNETKIINVPAVEMNCEGCSTAFELEFNKFFWSVFTEKFHPDNPISDHESFYAWLIANNRD
jgi:hypothetical protein